MTSKDVQSSSSSMSMIAYDHRFPPVDEFFIQAAIILACAFAESEVYVSLFSNSNNKATDDGMHSGETARDSADTGKPYEQGWTRSEILGNLSKPRVSFLPTRQLEALFSHGENASETLYLNSVLLDLYNLGGKYKRARKLAIVLIHCSVYRGLTYIIHNRLCKKQPTGDRARSTFCSDEIDYGNELEHRLFGGKLNTNLCELRIECRDGKVYEVDSNAFYDQLFSDSDTKVDVGKLKEIELKADQGGQRWMGLDEINRMHKFMQRKLQNRRTVAI